MIEYKFTFEDYNDFESFIRKHEEAINLMGQGEDNLTDQIRRQVQFNKQLPEHFEFTNNQYLQMMREDRSGMEAMEEDSRVTVNKMADEEEEGDGE